MEKFEKRCRDFFGKLWPAEEKRLVFGEGKKDKPRLMLIGEAPGEQETLQGGFLAAVGLKREEIFISNVVKIRPTRVSEKGRVSNRAPSAEELALFTPYLYEEILLVRPGAIVTLGNVPLHAVLDAHTTIGERHGRLAEATIRTEKEAADFPVYPLYHPASIIYNRALAQTYQDDLHKLRELLDDHVI